MSWENVVNIRLKRIAAFFRHGLIYWLPLALLMTAALARLVMPHLLDRMALPAYDLFQTVAPRATPDDPPVVIADIDERSIKALGQWPWPRNILAQLIDKLRDAGAADVAFDILFSEPDRTSPQAMLKLWVGRGINEEQAKQLLASMPDPDVQLAQTMKTMPTVIGFNLTDGMGTQKPLARAGYSTVGQAGADGLKFVQSFEGAVAALPAYQKAAAGDGFVNQVADWDNVVRRVPLVLRAGKTPVPSLAAEALRVGLGARGYILRYAGAQAEQSYGENTGLNAVEIQIPGAKPIEVP
ncbi:MAG TPA: CHASE2 domain-containing protein, partial [Stellaceae bacterium]|nr:CHASE2 domain-containing protein [Stellaceae bacterium]